MAKGYLIADIGTGNIRVGMATVEGEIVSVETCDTVYYVSDKYPDSLFFDPNVMWETLKDLTKKVMAQAAGFEIIAVTASSQREGVVLLNKNGESILGLPNIDNRGREWETEIEDPDRVYALSGKWVSAIFAGLKMRGLKERERDIYNATASFLSISDWVCFQFSGVQAYEPSQASETLLYDIENNIWSEELCDACGINRKMLPDIKSAGTILGNIRPDLADELGLNKDVCVITGAADTELAIIGSRARVGDVIIVSGTTTPVVKVVDRYYVDNQKRCWVSRNVFDNQFIVESNPGVTGLNYQRLKKIFFPHKSYEEVEQEILAIRQPKCIASFSTWIFDRQMPLMNAGFLMNAPLQEDLSPIDFMFALVFDIACSIKYNYDALIDISYSNPEYLLGCGGGFQGTAVPKFVADLTGKTIIVHKGFRQASILGGVYICNFALGIDNGKLDVEKVIQPSGEDYSGLYQKWLSFRNKINNAE